MKKVISNTFFDEDEDTLQLIRDGIIVSDTDVVENLKEDYNRICLDDTESKVLGDVLVTLLNSRNYEFLRSNFSSTEIGMLKSIESRLHDRDGGWKFAIDPITEDAEMDAGDDTDEIIVPLIIE